jgi:hypothetical protein
MSGNGDTKEKGKLTHRLSARIVDEDEKWVATFDETVPPADARSGHLPRERHKSVTCLDDFKFLSIERVYAICKLGRWKTSHVRVRPGGGLCIVARAPYIGCHLVEN